MSTLGTLGGTIDVTNNWATWRSSIRGETVVSLGPVNSPPFNPFWRHLAEDPGSSSQQKQNEDLSQNKTPEVKERARGNCKHCRKLPKRLVEGVRQRHCSDKCDREAKIRSQIPPFTSATAVLEGADAMQFMCLYCQRRPRELQGSHLHDHCISWICAYHSKQKEAGTEPLQPPITSHAKQTPKPSSLQPEATGLSGTTIDSLKTPGRVLAESFVYKIRQRNSLAVDNSKTAAAAPGGVCLYCGLSPKFVEGQIIHPYCSKTCASDAKTSTSVAQRSSKRASLGEAMFTLQTGAAPAPKNVAQSLVGWSHPPVVVRLGGKDPELNQVLLQFQRSWLHPDKEKQGLLAIFKITYCLSDMHQYHTYRNKIGGQESLLFHGTDRICTRSLPDLHSLPFFAPCLNATCALCSIIGGSFKVELSGTKNRFRRFGSGIYTTSCSSKADSYVNKLPGSNVKILLLNQVAIGTPEVKVKSDKNITGPSQGYHSVHGKATPGGSLNYDETVVYCNDAIRPAYLLVYNSTS